MGARIQFFVVYNTTKLHSLCFSVGIAASAAYAQILSSPVTMRTLMTLGHEFRSCIQSRSAEAIHAANAAICLTINSDGVW